MNDKLKQFAREDLKAGLSKLPESWQFMFKRLYSTNNLKATIDEVVDNMPDEDLDVAMMQVQNSLSKIESKKEELAKC